MNFEQAMGIMEQAIQLAVRGCQSISDMKAVLIAWDTIKPCIKEPETDGDDSLGDMPHSKQVKEIQHDNRAGS